MSDAAIRETSAQQPVPRYDTTPFVLPPPLAHACVAVVTTAALSPPGTQPIRSGDHSFTFLEEGQPLFLGHNSLNFDRTGWLLDTNVILPLDRLRELAVEGRIGSVARRHISFVGSQPEETLATIRLDSGPAAAHALREDGVDVVLLTPV